MRVSYYNYYTLKCSVGFGILLYFMDMHQLHMFHACSFVMQYEEGVVVSTCVCEKNCGIR